MAARRIFDQRRYLHFVTFTCYRRRRLLDHDESKRCVLGALNAQLERLAGRCVGFVVMPEHVHAILWFSEPGQLSEAMKQWKRMSSFRIKALLRERLSHYGDEIDLNEPIWQSKYYDFNLFSRAKIEEKLTYMHLNPVRAELVATPVDWPWSSARWYASHQTVGVPITWIE